jgi:hypothetical protein
MAEYDERKVLEVACPRCGSQPDDPCRTKSGKVSTDLHTARKAMVYESYGKNVKGGRKQGL